jgi:hypothetical protein
MLGFRTLCTESVNVEIRSKKITKPSVVATYQQIIWYKHMIFLLEIHSQYKSPSSTKTIAAAAMFQGAVDCIVNLMVQKKSAVDCLVNLMVQKKSFLKMDNFLLHYHKLHSKTEHNMATCFRNIIRKPKTIW